MLAFEDEDEASQFCQYYSLQVTDTEVLLDRSAYLEPESAMATKRSINLIESRLRTTVGEVSIYRILTELSFNINFYETSLENVVKRACGELYNISGMIS